MGPSGAGKTTLIKLICGTAGSSHELRSGRITLNGSLFTGAMYRSYCAVVTQYDRNWMWLTAREHVSLAHAFYQADLDGHGIEKRTTALLEQCGLTSCADLKVGSDIAAELALAGGANFPGVSGGQRRRLSLALAIAKKPALLVADEPTTGLDAAAATAIMTLLGQLARDSQMAVVCTIHQPSASVYEGIDTLLLLTKGCTAYYGPSNGLVEYLGTVGKPVPMGSSLAEHALNLVNADFTSDDAVDEMIEAWRKRASPPPMPAVGLSLPVVPARASGGRLMGTLLDKISRTNLSDFSYLCGRALVYFFLGSIYALVFVQVRDRHQVHVITLFYLIQFMIATVLFIALPTLNSACVRWPSYQREIRSGMYGPIAYWTVTSVISIVASFTLTLFAIPLLYIADDLPGSSFFKVWALLGALTLFVEASAELMAFAGQEAGTGLQGMVNMHTIQSSGAFQNPSNIIWPFRIFTYIFPGRFCFSGMLTAVFNGWDSDSDFSGAFRLPDAPVWLKESPRGLAAAANNRSFVCTGESNVCYASNGPDILRELHAAFEVADPNIQWEVYLGYIMAQWAVFRALGYLGAIAATRPSKGRAQATSTATEQSALLAGSANA